MTLIALSQIASQQLQHQGFRRFLGAWATCSLVVLLAVAGQGRVYAQETDFTLDHGNSRISVEPYAPNIVRITLSTAKNAALAPPGYGFIGKPSRSGWSRTAAPTEMPMMTFLLPQSMVFVSAFC